MARTSAVDMIEGLTAASLKADLPPMAIGDTVNVHSRIVEGDKERMRVDSYLDALRDLEGSLGGFAGGVMAGAACTKGTPPQTAMDFEAHMSDMPMVNRMFMDTIAMGFACGLTRVSSMMWGGGECHEPLNWLG